MRILFVIALGVFMLAACLKKESLGPDVVDPNYIADIRDKVHNTSPAAFTSIVVPGEGSICTLGSRGYKAGFMSGRVEYMVADNCDRPGIHVTVGPVEHDYTRSEDVWVVEDGLRSFSAWLDKQQKKGKI